MKLPNSMRSQVNVRIFEIESTLQLEITCFKLLGERTNTMKTNRFIILTLSGM